MHQKNSQLTDRQWDRLTAYRGMAALLVAAGHLVQVFLSPVTKVLDPYSGLLAQASVMIFFVISGASIASSSQTIMRRPSPIRNYLLHRGARILPPLGFSILLMAILALLAPLFFPSKNWSFLPSDNLARLGYFFNLKEGLLCTVFTNGFFSNTPNCNGPLWSLSYEVWLYVIFFMFVLGIARKNPLWVIFGISVFSILVINDKTYQMQFFKYAFVWFSGVIVYFLNTTGIMFKPKSIMTAILLITTSAFTVYFARIHFLYPDHNITSFNLAFGIFFACYLATTPVFMPAIIRSIFIPVAGFGYSLYLIHFPIYLFVFGMFQTWVMKGLASAIFIGTSSLIVSVLIAWGAASVVENRKLIFLLIDRGILYFNRP